MAFPFDNIVVQRRLGDSLRTRYVASGATAVWPLTDVSGQVVKEIIANRTGTSNNVSRGDAGMIPDYGPSTGFNGTASSVSVGHAAALAPSTSLAIASMVLPDALASNMTVFRKENGGAGGRILAGLKSSGPAFSFGANIGATYTELDYTITDTADWIADPRLLICRYTGASMQIWQARTTDYATPSYASDVRGDNPQLYWTLSDTTGTQAFDLSGNGRHGTYTGGATLQQTGFLSDGTTASSFDGVDDYVTVADHADLDLTTGFSIEVWFRATAFNHAGGGNFPRILCKGTAALNGYQVFVNQATGKINIELQGLSDQEVASTASVSTGTDYYLVVTYDGSNIRIYINGALDSTHPSTGSVTTNAAALEVGRRGDNARFWSGRIGQVVIHKSKVLSVTEIAARYALRTAGIGQVALLASRGASGAVAAGSGSDIYFGSNSASSDWFDGRLQWMAYWVNDYPTEVEMDGFGVAINWTNVGDIDHAAGITLDWGIRDGRPLSRVAQPGTMQFSHQNHPGNDGGLLGLYSPDHANVLSGWGFGSPYRLLVTDPATPSSPYVRFVGRLKPIKPVAGQYRPGRVVDCVVTDYMDELNRAKVPAVPLVDGEQAFDVFRRVLQEVEAKPHDIAAESAGIDTFDYGLDLASLGAGTSVLQVADALMRSELGYLYVRGSTGPGGVLTLQTRQERETKTTADWTFSNDMHELEVSRDPADVITRVEVTAHPREEGVTPITLFTLGEPLLFNYGTSRTIRCEYTDPDNPGQPIGSFDVDTPTFAAFANADGTGADLTSYITLRKNTEGSGFSELEFTYSGAYAVADIWLTSVVITGKPARSNEPVTAVALASEATRAHYGENVLGVDQPFEHDPTEADNDAQYLLAGNSTPRTVGRTLTIRVMNGSPSALISAALRGDVGDLVKATEALTGLSAAEYFVNGVRSRMQNGVIETDLILAPRDLGGWLLEVTGRSEVETAKVGY